MKKSETRNGKLDLSQTMCLKSAVSVVLKAFRLTYDIGKLLCPTADVLGKLCVKYVGFQSVWLTGHGGRTKKSLIIKCNETTAAVGERKGKREGDGDGILMTR